MICVHCRRPIHLRKAEDEYDLDEWVHSLTGRTSCDMFASPGNGRPEER